MVLLLLFQQLDLCAEREPTRVSIIAFLLVSLSACTHALWNYLGKRQNPPAAFFLMASLASALIFLPVLFLCRKALFAIPAEVWGLILVTGAVQGIYYIFLAAAYRNGDLSHTYPLARSLPVVFIAFTSILLGRGNQIQLPAYAGFMLVTLGCLLLPLPKFSDIHPRHYRQKWVLFSLLAAVCISGYMLIDDQALRILRLGDGMISNIAWSVLYLELETISIGFFMLILLFLWPHERRLLLQSRKADWKAAFRMGFIITATYGLVLLAMGYVTNVSYVMAFRQLSIPIGALMGILGRKEPAHAPKLIGIGLVAAGLILTSIG